MNIDDLVEEKGESILELKELVVPEEVTSLKGIERFKRIRNLVWLLPKNDEIVSDNLQFLAVPNLLDLNELVILKQKYTSDIVVNELEPLKEYNQLRCLVIDGVIAKDLSFLYSPSLKKKIEVLRISYLEGASLSFLEEYERIKELGLRQVSEYDQNKSGSKKVKVTMPADYSQLGKLSDKITSLSLKGLSGIKNLEIITRYKNLEKIFLTLPNPIDYSGLASRNLRKTVKEITINIGIHDFFDSLAFLEGYERLERISIYGGEVRLRDYASLYSPLLKETLKELVITPCYGITDLSFLKGMKKLEALKLKTSIQVKDYTGLGDPYLNKSIVRLDFTALRSLKELSFLRGYEKLQSLDLNLCTAISDFDALSSDSLGKSVEEMNLHMTLFSDLSVIAHYEKLQKVNIIDTRVDDLSPLLNSVYVKNNSLKEIRVGGQINWLLIHNGKYVNGETVQELKKRGVTVILPNDFHYQKPELEYALADYLSNDLNLTDKSVDALCRYFEYSAAEFKEEYLGIRFVQERSFHKVIRARSKKNKEIVLKIHSNKLKAEIEQAANYFLSQAGMDFVVKTNQKEPFSYAGLYITVQNDVSDELTRKEPLPYYLAMLAKLHAHGKEIMEDHCIPLPKREIPEFIQIYEIIHYSLNRFKTLSRAKIRESESQYTEFKRMLEESNHALLHGDPKYQNMNGRYLLDLEGLTIGDESLDLAVILNDPKRILSEGHKKACLSLYYHFYCKEKGCQYREESLKELIMKVNAATFVRRLNSIAWNLLYIKEEGETAKEKLLYLSS